MAKILGSNFLEGTIQRIMETPRGYIINGHYYDKNTMSPIPLKTFPIQGDNFDLAMNNRFINRHIHSEHKSKCFGDTIIEDTKTPGISYLFTTKMRTNNIMVHKIKEENDNCTILNTMDGAALGTTAPLFYEYFGQDEIYVYFADSCNGGNTYLFKMHKQTLIITLVHSFGTFSNTTLIKDTEQYMYYAAQRNNGFTNAYRFNKHTQLQEIITVNARGSVKLFDSRISKPISVLPTNDIFFGIHQDPITTKHVFNKYSLNYNETNLTKMITETGMTIDWGTSGITEIPITITNTSIVYELFINENSTGEKYLNVSLHSKVAHANVAYINDYGIYTFLIDSVSNTLTFKGKTQVSSNIYNGFLGTRKNNFLVCATPSNVVFVEFNESEEKFKVIQSMNSQPYHIGIDMSENIWIVNGAQEVEIISPFVPTDINMKWEKTDFKYEGSPINTYITLEAKNYANTNIEANLDLTIVGNAVFMPSNKKNVVEATSTTGVKQLMLQITGPGAVTVYPKLVF